MPERRKDEQNWSQRNWRAAMGWQYMIICLFDFMIAPIISWAFAYYTKTPLVQWVPITTSGAGLYHLSMGAIIGVTSWGKTKEKLTTIENAPGTFPQQEEPLTK